VLSPGSDPFGSFQRFADEMGFKERIRSISLGQGQGPVAEKIIEQGLERGDWVFLQVLSHFYVKPLLKRAIFRTVTWQPRGC
jgi:hypothetical protein